MASAAVVVLVVQTVASAAAAVWAGVVASLDDLAVRAALVASEATDRFSSR